MPQAARSLHSGVPGDAAVVAAGAVHGFDDLQQGNLARPQLAGGIRRAGPLLDLRKPSRARSCRILARKCGGGSGFGGDVFHHGVFAGGKRRHVHKSADGVFGGAGVDHEKNTSLSEKP